MPMIGESGASAGTATAALNPGGDCAGVASPLFILSPPRSFSSIVSAMIGQHPQMYGLPETNLLSSDSVGEWYAHCRRASHRMDHGVLRTIAELLFSAQNEDAIALARQWLLARAHWSTGQLLQQFATWVRPRQLVEKSPRLVYHEESLRRLLRMFPRSRLIHLLRHPRGQCTSVMNLIRWIQQRGRVARWLLDLAAFPIEGEEQAPSGKGLDPQGAWLQLNSNICSFLRTVPTDQWIRVKSESLLTDPGRVLGELCRWLGIRDDPEAIERMTHPETSPFAKIGPRGAEAGNDILFLQNPRLCPSRVKPQSLEGPLEWRPDAAGFSSRVTELAREFGYQ
jgi:hypothetical protein